MLPLWLRGNKLRKVTRLARVLPTPRVRAGLDQQDHEQESCLLYYPRQQPSHTHHHQEACQILFLTPAKGSPSLPFHGIVHHCQNNSDKIQWVFLAYVTNFLQAFSRLICSFSQMPLSPRATETRSRLIWHPRLLPVGIFLTEGLGPGLGGGQGFCTLDGEGEERATCAGHQASLDQLPVW